MPEFVVNSMSLAFTDFTNESEMIIGVYAKSQPYLSREGNSLRTYRAGRGLNMTSIFPAKGLFYSQVYSIHKFSHLKKQKLNRIIY